MKALICYEIIYHPEDRDIYKKYIDKVYLINDEEDMTTLSKKYEKECSYTVPDKRTKNNKRIMYTKSFDTWMEQFEIKYEER